MIKKIICAFAILSLLASCASSQFQAYEGPALPSEKIASVYSPKIKKNSRGTESIRILTANGIKIENTKLIQLPAGHTIFTYKYNAEFSASSFGWALLMAFTGILPGAIAYGVVLGVAEANNPIHTFEADIESGKFYNVEFKAPFQNRNNAKAWLVESEISAAQ